MEEFICTLKKLQRKNLKISVVIPTYNRSFLVQRAIKSVLSQTLLPHEIIVIDDGSTDNTIEILKNYPVKVISQKNSGVSSARNLGIKNSSGNVIAFLDSDDEWKEDKLKTQLAFHEKGCKFSHTEEIWIKNDKELKQKAHHKKPEGECFYENISFCKISPSTVMIDKDLFEKVSYFDESLKVCEDFDMWLRVLKLTPAYLVKKVLTIKYSEDEQLSFKYFGMDRFRITALLKHLPNKRVKKEIEKKLSILKKGALKHKNKEIIDFVSKIQNTL